MNVKHKEDFSEYDLEELEEYINPEPDYDFENYDDDTWLSKSNFETERDRFLKNYYKNI